MLAQGTRLGPYEISAAIGAGGMGEVYRARDTRLGRTVAIKVVRSDEGVDSEARRRFRREAQIASRLTHPHVCTLFDVGAEGAIDYLVLEHLEGTTLADRLSRGALPPAEALSIAGDTAEALAFAHEQGFVHRDLKPANVFLTPSGTKLLDFGLARAAASEPLSASDTQAMTASAPLTEEGRICGTPPYMSPEQAAGRPVDERSDQFSLGAVLFEMLTGRRAFPGRTPVETLSGVLRDDPLASAPPGAFPAGLGPLLARLLAKDPAARFPSTRAALEELRAARRALESGSDSTLEIPAAKEASRRRRVVLWAAVLAAAIALAVVLASRTRRGSAIDSVAILPIATTSSDPESALLADGMTDGLINGLAELPSLRVMAHASVARFKGREVDPREVGRALDVRAVVTGHLAPHGDRVTASVALADARDGRHLWGASAEKPASELLALQSQLARDLGRELTKRLTGAQEVRLAKPATADHEAYLLFLKGRYFWAKRTRESLLKGVELFRQALDRDPNYAPAWTGLAESYDVLGFTHYLAPRDAFARALEAARKATELDPNLADAWSVLAHVTMLGARDFVSSEAYFKKAIALNPSSPSGHHWYAHLLMQEKRWTEAERESRATLDVDPLSLIANIHLGEFYFATGKDDAAIAQYRKAIEMDPSFGMAHWFFGGVLLKVGRLDEAITELREASRLLPDSTDVLGQLGAALARAGRRPEAEEVLARLESTAKERFVSGIAIAAVAASLGNADLAVRELSRALDDGDVGTATLVDTDPRFRFLKDDPRYRDLIVRFADPPPALSRDNPRPTP